MRVWRNWQTRKIQVLMPATAYRFDSCYPHQKGIIRTFYSSRVIGSDLLFYFRIYNKVKGLAGYPQALLPLFKVYDIRLNLSEIHILSYFFRIRLFIADLFKYRLCGLSLCIQQDSFLFNFVFSCRFCLSAFHSSNSLFPSSVSKSD